MFQWGLCVGDSLSGAKLETPAQGCAANRAACLLLCRARCWWGLMRGARACLGCKLKAPARLPSAAGQHARHFMACTIVELVRGFCKALYRVPAGDACADFCDSHAAGLWLASGLCVPRVPFFHGRNEVMGGTELGPRDMDIHAGR